MKKGQLLAQIDPAPYLAVLTQAQGTLERDQALARQCAPRSDPLSDPAWRQNAIARQTCATPSAPWSSRMKAPSRPTKARSPPPRSMSAGAASSRRSTDASACAWSIPAISSAPAVRSAARPATAAATNASSSTGNGGTGIVIVNQIEPIAVTFTVPEGDFQQLSGSLPTASSKPLADQGVEPGNRRAAGQRAS